MDSSFDSYISNDVSCDDGPISEPNLIYSVNQRLQFKNYGTIFSSQNDNLGDSKTQIDEEKVAVIFDKILTNESNMETRLTDASDEIRRIESDVKRWIRKTEIANNENEQKDRKFNQALAREAKHLKRIDELELKLRHKCEETRKLEIQTKNNEAKYKIDKRKIDKENNKLKAKINDFSHSGQKGAKAKSARLNATINFKPSSSYGSSEFDYVAETSTIGNILATTVHRLESINRDLIEKNSKIKNILESVSEKVEEVKQTCPNFFDTVGDLGQGDSKNIKREPKFYDQDSDVEVSEQELVEVNVEKIEQRIATDCNLICHLMEGLQRFNEHKVNEMGKDLEARHQKQLVTKLAQFEVKLEDAKKCEGEVNVDDAFELVAKYLGEDAEGESDENDENIPVDGDDNIVTLDEKLLQGAVGSTPIRTNDGPKNQGQVTPDWIRELNFDAKTSASATSTPDSITRRLSARQGHSPFNSHLANLNRFEDDSLEY